MPLLLLILLFLIIGFFASCIFNNIASAIDHIVTALLKLTLLAGIIILTFSIVRWIRLKDQIISYKNGRDMESNRTTIEQKQNQYKQSEYLE
jgi:hypothetical protein